MQLLNPNASFVGHVAGILAGLLHCHTRLVRRWAPGNAAPYTPNQRYPMRVAPMHQSSNARGRYVIVDGQLRHVASSPFVLHWGGQQTMRSLLLAAWGVVALAAVLTVPSRSAAVRWLSWCRVPGVHWDLLC